MNKNNIYIATFIVSITTLILIMQPYENIVTEILRILFGSIFILFLPGYFIVKSFFHESEIDILESLALSFALSISIIPLISFYLNLINVPINELSIFMIVSGIILLNIFYTLMFKKGKKA